MFKGLLLPTLNKCLGQAIQTAGYMDSHSSGLLPGSHHIKGWYIGTSEAGYILTLVYNVKPNVNNICCWPSTSSEYCKTQQPNRFECCACARQDQHICIGETPSNKCFSCTALDLLHYGELQCDMGP